MSVGTEDCTLIDKKEASGVGKKLESTEALMELGLLGDKGGSQECASGRATLENSFWDVLAAPVILWF